MSACDTINKKELEKSERMRIVEKRVALVTGSASGLGVQTVLELAQQGHQIIINYRESKDRAMQLKEKVEQLGVSCLSIRGDISIEQDCQLIVSQAIDTFGKVDILVNNAGPYIFDRKKMIDYTTEEWQHIINGNLNAVFYLAKATIPIMRRNKWGRIINFGFNHAGQAAGWMFRSAFAASKTGLVSLTKTLAQEESENGITVNMICPGDIIGENKEKKIDEISFDLASNMAPVGRPGSGEDVARLVSFLSAEKSDFITGSIIEVNGGLNVLGKKGIEE